MTRRLLWKLCLIIATGVVALFYLISYLTSRAEEDMSLLDLVHREELTAWGKRAEKLYLSGDIAALASWLTALEKQENTTAAVVTYDITKIVGEQLDDSYYTSYNFGRSVDWKVHLYFKANPLIEIPFATGQSSFLIVLPDRMRPGSYWPTTRLALQIVMPMLLLIVVSLLLYRHIMQPLRTLESATRDFTKGNFSVRVRQLLGNRNDELTELANTFDTMAARIGELIVSQRQLIADLSHELRTPLTRLDIAVESIQTGKLNDENLARVNRESRHIRRLVEDTLTLAWLDNEQPTLAQEDLDLVDLIDVIIEDAKFEFPDRHICVDLPASAALKNSNHRAVGQALENIIRNALRFTPAGKVVDIGLQTSGSDYLIQIKDQGPGVPEDNLETIFQPFFRLDKSRSTSSTSFGLGLALARRQLHAVGGRVLAENLRDAGLRVSVWLPKI